MRVDAFDFELPGERIALRPAVPRDSSRLLVVDPAGPDEYADRTFNDLPSLLNAGDVLVFNDTRVIPARLHGHRTGRGDTTPKIEVTLHRRVDEHSWWAFAKPARKLQPGDMIAFGPAANLCLEEALSAKVMEKAEGGEVLLGFEQSGQFLDQAIVRHGEMPLPSLHRFETSARHARLQLTIRRSYLQRSEGAVAAPTAGLHFTAGTLLQILGRQEGRGACRRYFARRCAGTFLPVKAETTEDHHMHAEWGDGLKGQLSTRLNAASADRGSRVVCIGTTSPCASSNQRQSDDHGQLSRRFSGDH